MTELPAVQIPLTADNIDKWIDEGQLYVAINNGRWWKARRNGMTKRGKRLPTIRVPFKYGLKHYGALTETDFSGPNGTLPSHLYRHHDDVPVAVRS